MKDNLLNIRLNEEEQRKLKLYAEEHNLTKTQVVKEAMELYFSTQEMNSYEIGKDLFGVERDNATETSSSTFKNEIKKKLNEKYSH